MAKSAREIVFEGMELIPDGLIPFVEKRLSSAFANTWQNTVFDKIKGLNFRNGKIHWDQLSLLKAITIFWEDSFKTVLGKVERSWTNELIDVRNKISHNEAFTYADSERALDTMSRLLRAVSAGDIAQKLENMRIQILKVQFTEQQRSLERSQQNLNFDTKLGLKCWREVIEPHKDVASGDFIQAEFAADLSKVYNQTASKEYSDPKEFYSRTFLTEGLKHLLKGAIERLSGTGGEPVVELQTNFGGGKTHSLLALYHMAGEINPKDLYGLDKIMNNINFDDKISRAVLVGTSRGPLDSIITKDGLCIKTTWGEMAYQLGGKEGYEMVQKQDEEGIAPGSNILEAIFLKYSPCIILIDEWVAYLRQIYKEDDLPSGSFDSNLSFVQSLTEAVKNSSKTLLVASLPASQIEVGGEGGQEALARLEQTFRRLHSSWLPASQEESYEIVRRRLFNDISGENLRYKDNTIKQYLKMYKEDKDNFPDYSYDTNFKVKFEKSYPIHPELFDQLYEKWSSIDKFQRTRGILRLMAQVVHELWIGNDNLPVIMPCSIPLNSQRIQPELTKYLPQGWPSIIASDVDGENSTPYQIDAQQPSLAKISATRRVARVVFMNTAPFSSGENSAVNLKRVNLGCQQPSEKSITFNDALSRLSNSATYLHSDTGKYWYSITASLNKLVSDNAKAIDKEVVLDKINKELHDYINTLPDKSIFQATHIAPGTSADVEESKFGVRMVVLDVHKTHSRGNQSSDAILEAKNIINYSGSSPRSFKNTLIFLAADSRSLDTLISTSRKCLAWEEIVEQKTHYNLNQNQLSRAENSLTQNQKLLSTRLKETWNWIIYPFQKTAHEDFSLEAFKLQSQDRIYEKICKKLEDNGALFDTLGPNNLNSVLEKYIWQDKNHIFIKDLIEYHAKYIYMPRVLSDNVLKKTILAAISEIIPGPFAYAEKYDSETKNYTGLVIHSGMNTQIVITSDSVIVNSKIAEQKKQQDISISPNSPSPDNIQSPSDEENISDHLPTKFYTRKDISIDRPAKEFSNISENIIDQLSSIPGAKIEITIEINSEVKDGIEKDKQRILIENANALGLKDTDLS